MVTEIRPLGSPVIQLDNDAGAHDILFQEIAPGAIVPIEYVGENLAPAIPSESLLGSLRDGRLRVNSPIEVKFTTEGEHVIAEAVELNEFGFGENPSEALIDLQRAIAELYLTLEKEQKRLGTDLQGVWTILQEKILKR
jgi:hypothetical protein